MKQSLNVDHIRFQSLSQVEALEILTEVTAYQNKIVSLEKELANIKSNMGKDESVC